jgi:hypothetical protein
MTAPQVTLRGDAAATLEAARDAVGVGR